MKKARPGLRQQLRWFGQTVVLSWMGIAFLGAMVWLATGDGAVLPGPVQAAGVHQEQRLVQEDTPQQLLWKRAGVLVPAPVRFAAGMAVWAAQQGGWLAL